jgi:simple sugar transport system substrate-binding protein
MALLTRRKLLGSSLALSGLDLLAQTSGGLPPLINATPLIEPLKVCFIYVGPVGDGGWTFSHDQGRKSIEREFGARIQTSFVENVPESADATKPILDVIAQGNKLIFATTFGYMEPLVQIAKMNPSVKFEHATGYKSATNLKTYDSRMYEGAYIAGMIAGGMTKTNILGFVASIPIPEIIRNINSFTLGALSVNPNIRTKVVWVNEWYNQDNETKAAQLLINSGADILIQNTDSPAVLKAAQKSGIKAFGWNSDMRHYSPQAHLGSVVNNWSNYYKKSINDALNNRWVGGMGSWWGIKENTIEIASISKDIPDVIMTRPREAFSAIKSGTLKIWRGPIVSSTGKQILNFNEFADDKFLSGMNYFVQGVEGKVPG